MRDEVPVDVIKWVELPVEIEKEVIVEVPKEKIVEKRVPRKVVKQGPRDEDPLRQMQERMQQMQQQMQQMQQQQPTQQLLQQMQQLQQQMQQMQQMQYQPVVTGSEIRRLAGEGKVIGEEVRPCAAMTPEHVRNPNTQINILKPSPESEQKRKPAAAPAAAVQGHEKYLKKMEDGAKPTAKAAQEAAANAQARASEKERALQKMIEHAMAGGVIDERKQKEIDRAKAEVAKAQEEAANAAAAAQARNSEEAAANAQARASEKERALQRMIEDAMAGGVIDERKQKEMDLAKAEVARAQEEVAKAAAAAQARNSEEAAVNAQVGVSEKERALQRMIEDAMAGGVIDERKQEEIDLAKAEVARAQEEAANAAAAAQARNSEEAAVNAQVGASEKERALQKTIEDAMADGVIDEQEQKAIDLAKAEAARAQQEEAAKAAAAEKARKAEEAARLLNIKAETERQRQREEREREREKPYGSRKHIAHPPEPPLPPSDDPEEKRKQKEEEVYQRQDKQRVQHKMDFAKRISQAEQLRNDIEAKQAEAKLLEAEGKVEIVEVPVKVPNYVS